MTMGDPAVYSVNFHTTSDARFPPPTLPANYAWDDLVDILSREIGPEAACLLAEPRYEAARGETHWYVETDHDPVPFAKLDEPGRTALNAKLAAIQAKVETRSAELTKNSNEKAKRQAKALRLVVAIPDDSCLWSLDGEPLLSCSRRSTTAFRTASSAPSFADCMSIGAPLPTRFTNSAAVRRDRRTKRKLALSGPTRRGAGGRNDPSAATAT